VTCLNKIFTRQKKRNGLKAFKFASMDCSLL